MKIKCYLDDLTPKLNNYYTVLPAIAVRLSPFRQYNNDNDPQTVGWDLSFHFEFWQWDLVVGFKRHNNKEKDDN